MQGSYEMENENNKELFTVVIPAFDLIVPSKLN
jgi:ApaG protein